MGERLTVFLAHEENRTLFEMRAATNVPQKVKDQAEAIRLNTRGFYVSKVVSNGNLI